MRALLVTGSDTGAGKTRVTGEIARAMARAGLPVQVVKVVETGVAPGSGTGDAATAAAFASEGGSPVAQAHTLFTFAAALAPAAAARLEGREVRFGAVVAACQALPLEARGWRIYEGAGGIATPLDSEGRDWADFAVAAGIEELVVVVPDRLGAINQARLCAARAEACGLRARIWLNAMEAVPPAVAASNREALTAAGVEWLSDADQLWQQIAGGAADANAGEGEGRERGGDGALHRRLEAALMDRERLRRRRRLRVHAPAEGALNLADNDYFGLARDPALAAAAAGAAGRFGTSAAASPLLTGWLPPHEELVARLCAWQGFACGLLWTSGYAANAAILSTLPAAGDVILADRLVHASMIAGMTRSAARFRRYSHLDLTRLEAELRGRREAGGAVFVVTESVFSMDGDYPDLGRLAALKREHGFILVVDEAHGLGWYGGRGAGLVEETGIAAAVDVFVGTLGKTLGSGGAFALFHDPLLRDYLLNHAGELIYSTGIPPGAAAAAGAAVQRVEAICAGGAPWRALSTRFRAGLREDGWDVPDGDSPIVPVRLGDEGAALAAAAFLEERGILAAAVRPPTVPAGTSRLRFSLKRTLGDADLHRVREALRRWREKGGT